MTDAKPTAEPKAGKRAARKPKKPVLCLVLYQAGEWEKGGLSTAIGTYTTTSKGKLLTLTRHAGTVFKDDHPGSSKHALPEGLKFKKDDETGVMRFVRERVDPDDPDRPEWVGSPWRKPSINAYAEMKFVGHFAQAEVAFTKAEQAALALRYWQM